jgi:hypothetical protein
MCASVAVVLSIVVKNKSQLLLLGNHFGKILYLLHFVEAAAMQMSRGTGTLTLAPVLNFRIFTARAVLGLDCTYNDLPPRFIRCSLILTFI